MHSATSPVAAAINAICFGEYLVDQRWIEAGSKGSKSIIRRHLKVFVIAFEMALESGG